MAFDVAQFRIDFAEFSDESKYSDGNILFWAGIAEVMLKQERWRELYTQGLSLFVAHNITLASQNTKGTPGTFAGAKQSKAVGAASASYDTASSAMVNGGPWNLTTYGKNLLQLSRMIGVGAVQL